MLKKIFDEDLKCLLPEVIFRESKANDFLLQGPFFFRADLSFRQISFTTSPILSQRFASTSALQFHSLLPSLADLVTYIQQVICNPNDTDCQSHASSLLSADSVDIDYDSISHSLTFSGFWSKPPEGQDGWTEDIRKHNKGTNEKVEVGLLAAQKAVEPEELSMGGFLTVIGEDKKLSKLTPADKFFFSFVQWDLFLTTLSLPKNLLYSLFRLDTTPFQRMPHIRHHLSPQQDCILR